MENALENLLKHKALKPRQLKINADSVFIPQDISFSSEQIQAMGAIFRKIVFDTAQMARQVFDEDNKKFLKSLKTDTEADRITYTILKLLLISQQNGLVDYANCLIASLDFKEKNEEKN